MTRELGHPLGVIRIHVRAHDRAPHGGRWWRKFIRRDLAHQIVHWAHEAGLPMAMAHRAYLGFVNHGPIIDDAAGESPNPHAMIVVDVAGDAALLRAFVDRHRAALTGTHIQFAEAWDWSPHHAHIISATRGHQVHHRTAHHEQEESHEPS